MIHLTVVGIGPGDPNLITIKGMQAIQAARLLFAPQTSPHEESRALRIAHPWIDRSRQHIVPLTMPMCRDSTSSMTMSRVMAKEMAAYLSAYAERYDTLNAVYLLLGDPMLYGTFTALHQALLTYLPTLTVEIIPGITSFAAVAARACLPLATHTERLAVVSATAHLDQAALHQLCNDFQTVVIMKVGQHLPQLMMALDELGLLGHTLYAEYVGMPEEYITDDMTRLRDRPAPYLSLLIVRSPRGDSQP